MESAQRDLDHYLTTYEETIVSQTKFTVLPGNSCGLSIRSEDDSACEAAPSVLRPKSRYPLLYGRQSLYEQVLSNSTCHKYSFRQGTLLVPIFSVQLS